SGMLYLSVVIPSMAPYALPITIGVLVLLGILNWVGISESARVSLVGAVVAFISDLAILFTVFTHISFAQFLALIPHMFANHRLTLYAILIGFANSFLAFSGLESISQLSPVMKHPHKKVAGQALLLVILTIGLTSPLLTMLSTLLLPREANDPVLSAQLISLLAGHWGNIILQTEVAISASALLVFASNTAIIGAYHVFMALSRMEFLPEFVLKRNKLRGTPHFSIMLATGIPIVILIAVLGNINLLGDMYAFGLLGAFTLTCLGLDIVRYREWKAAREAARQTPRQHLTDGQVHLNPGLQASGVSTLGQPILDAQLPTGTSTPAAQKMAKTATSVLSGLKGLWFKIDFWLGVLTTFLVALAWSTNLVTKVLATEFGGGVALLGMAIAYTNHVLHAKKTGLVPVSVVVTRVQERLPDAVLAILTPTNGRNEAVIRAAVSNASHPEHKKPVVFLYLAEPRVRSTAPRMLEIVDPYLEDRQAKEYFGKAESMALKAKIPTRRFVYLQKEPDAAAQVWQVIHPHDTVIAAENDEQFKDINPDRIRYELTPAGKVAHLLKRW
ncbi:MAG: APC family permease, partial [Ktedonobacteraceae bacterium]